MVDWIYNSIGDQKRVELGGILPRRNATKNAFAELLTKQICGFDACYEIATDAKHFIVKNPRRDDVADSIGRFYPGDEGPDSPSAFEAVSIQVDDKAEPAHALLFSVMAAWSKYLDDAGL